MRRPVTEKRDYRGLPLATYEWQDTSLKLHLAASLEDWHSFGRHTDLSLRYPDTSSTKIVHVITGAHWSGPRSWPDPEACFEWPIRGQMRPNAH